jgi:hypothetical protein
VANHQSGWAYARGAALALCATSALAACGARESAGGDRLADQTTETRTSALDTRDSARAAYFAAEAARYRDIAAHDRQLSAAYARLTLPAAASKNWNTILKARVEARAAAADQIAAGIQMEADFHAAKAGAQ